MRKICRISGVVMALMLGFCAAALAEAKPYPLPEEIARSTACEVTVDGLIVPVMDTAVNLTRIWTSRPVTTTSPVARFEITGTTLVTVRFVGQSIQTAVVRPLALGFVPTVADDTVSFTLTKPAALTVEINGGQAGAAHLFADA
ncbi:MAG: hypothetical protein LLF96_13580, partial [Eubacteriales bacterium]|nr:hypothetical protein [Eubacteriales bacterium]